MCARYEISVLLYPRANEDDIGLVFWPRDIDMCNTIRTIEYFISIYITRVCQYRAWRLISLGL